MKLQELQHRLKNNRSTVWSAAMHHIAVILLHLEGTAAAAAVGDTLSPISKDELTRALQYIHDLKEALDAIQEA